MNLFVLSDMPMIAAQSHADVHVAENTKHVVNFLTVPMVTSMRTYSNEERDHPCAEWVRATRGNYRWTLRLAECLCDEYDLRFHHVHGWRSIVRVARDHFNSFETKLPDGDLQPFLQHVPAHCKSEDAVQAYRMHYLEMSELRWLSGERLPPPWWQDAVPDWEEKNRA